MFQTVDPQSGASSVSEITYPIPAVGTKSRSGSKRLWLWFRLAFKELLNHRRFSIFFILNLSLGLAGFIALDSFQVSLDRHLTRNSKSILGADISISSRMPVPPETLNQLEQMLPSPWEASKKIHFVTMAANESNSRLIQLVAIENGFPYYGKLVLGNQKNANPKMVDEELIKAGKLWAYPELLITLGLEIGDTLRLGEVDFIVGDVVLEDPSSAFNTFGVAPRVYVGMPQAMETGLLTQKSRVYYENLYKFSDHQEIQKLEDELENKIRLMGNSNERIRVRTHEDASENLGRVLGYLNDYLGLIALIALFLASIGAAYLFRSFLQTRFREMAVLMSLGAHRRETFQVVIWQLVLMGTLASVLAMIFSVLLLPALPMLLEEFLPRGFETMVRVRSLLLALMIGSIGSIVFCLPVLHGIRKVQPLSLFSAHVEAGKSPGSWNVMNLLSYLPLVITYWLLAVWQSQSLLVGSLFIALLLGCIMLLGLFGLGMVKLTEMFGKTRAPFVRLALKNLSRNRLSAVSCFMAIAMGTLLINLVPQIQQGLLEEISKPKDFKLPSLFLFDIQPEQTDPLKSLLADQQIPLDMLSPLIRARLVSVNGEPFQREMDDSNRQMLTREEERERRFRSRGLNVSYRPELFNSEKIVAGSPLSNDYDFDSGLPAEISIEERYASRLGLEIGDLLVFDVQGIPVEGKIVNLRQVKWNSFQPNFFILFQTGVLEDAPASFLGSVSGLDAASRISVQTRIIKEFPNVSVIDVTRIVGRVIEITDQMSLAIRMMAYLSILVGMVVVFSIARYEVQRRYREINLLKVLGAGFSNIRSMILLEFGILSSMAAFFGVVLSMAMSYTLSWQIFESLWHPAWLNSGMGIAGVTFLGMVVSLLATSGVLRQKPLVLLQTT